MKKIIIIIFSFALTMFISCKNHPFEKKKLLPVENSVNSLKLIYDFSPDGWDTGTLKIFKVNGKIKINDLKNYPKINKKKEGQLIKWHRIEKQKERKHFQEVYYSEFKYGNSEYKSHLLNILSLIKNKQNLFYVAYYDKNTKFNTTQFIYVPEKKLLYFTDAFSVTYYNEIRQKSVVDSLLNL